MREQKRKKIVSVLIRCLQQAYNEEEKHETHSLAV